MTVAQKVARNSLLQLGGRGLTMAIALGTLTVLARYLGPTRFGQYQLVIAFLTLVNISDLGVATIAVRHLSTTERDPDELMGNVLDPAARCWRSCHRCCDLHRVHPRLPVRDQVRDRHRLALVPAHDLQRLVQRDVRGEPADGVRGSRQHRAVGREPHRHAGGRADRRRIDPAGRRVRRRDPGEQHRLPALRAALRAAALPVRLPLQQAGRARSAASRHRRARDHGVRPDRHRDAEGVHR